MSILGANWKTTVTGGLQSIFSAIVTGSLTFPADWHNVKQVALFVCVIVGTFFGAQFAHFTKSKNVTGGDTMQTVSGDVADRGTQTMVDQTVKASIASGDKSVTPEQKRAALS